LKKLDRSKPFAEIFGPSANGHRFEQNGINFGPDGLEMVPKISTPTVQEQISIPQREYGSDHPWEMRWRVFGEEPGALSPREEVVVVQEPGNLFEHGGSASGSSTGKARGGRTLKQ